MATMRQDNGWAILAGGAAADELSRPFRTILVAVDDRESGLRVAMYGLRLARYCRAAMLVVATVDYRPHEAFRVGVGAYDVYVDEYRQRLQALNEAGNHQGVTVKAFLSEGYPEQVILELAASEQADLIVMPACSCRAIEAALVRCPSQRVARKAQCPVLLCGPETR